MLNVLKELRIYSTFNDFKWNMQCKMRPYNKSSQNASNRQLITFIKDDTSAVSPTSDLHDNKL